MAQDPFFMVSPRASSLRDEEVKATLQRLAGADARQGPAQPTEAMIRRALEAPHDASGPAIGRHGFSTAEAERIYRERYALLRAAHAEGRTRDPSEAHRQRRQTIRAERGISPADAVRAGEFHKIVPGLVNLASLATDLHRQGYSAEQIQAAILGAHREGFWELQADTGIGRFTREQLALLPPGPRGTHLTSARILQVPATSAASMRAARKTKKQPMDRAEKSLFDRQFRRGLQDAKGTDSREPIAWQIKNWLGQIPIGSDPVAAEKAYREGFAAGVAKRPRSLATRKKIAKILAIEKRLQKTGRQPDATRAELLQQSDQQIADLLEQIEEIESLADKKARREKVEKMAATRKSPEEKAREKAQKAAAREAKKAATAANREAAKAAAAQEKAAQKAALAAQKAADKAASKAQKKAAAAAARQARKEAKKAEALAARKVNEAARAATIRGEEPPPFEIEEWEKIPFTADALLAASPEDARKLIGRAGRGQRSALRRQLRGELRSLRQQVVMLKKARKQRIAVIRARCRDAARQIRERMRLLREEFLRAWKALKAEDAGRKQACSADLRQVMDEIGPALANAGQRQARVAELAGEIAKLSARRQLTRKMVEGRESAQDRLRKSDMLVRRDLEHFMGDVFPMAPRWWDLKGVKMAELKPGKVPERMSRSELVMQYVQENTGEIMRFLSDHQEKEIARQEKELAKKEKEYARVQGRRAIQRAGRARRMGSPGRNRMQIEEQRRKFYEDAPF